MIHQTSRFLTTELGSHGIDVGTELFKLTPSSTDVGPIVDSATEVLALVPSSTEFITHLYLDAGTELFKLIPSGTDIRASVDAGTELFYLIPDADEHFCPQKVEFEGDLTSRWEAASGVKWPASMTSRWEAEFLGVGEGFAC